MSILQMRSRFVLFRHEATCVYPHVTIVDLGRLAYRRAPNRLVSNLSGTFLCYPHFWTINQELSLELQVTKGRRSDKGYRMP